ncbi:MAG: pilus assembly protein PilM [candidate division Zixibacteria bacterium]|nr:pilus assembly protein PilM [candidate division Zixibacteria bacterium]
MLSKLLSKKGRNVVGLDIGTSSIKLVKLEKKATGYALKNLAIKELPPEAIVEEEIRDRETVLFTAQGLIDQTDPKMQEVAIALAGHGVITDKITIDKKTGAEAEQAILFEAEQRAPFDVDDVVMDSHIIKVNEETNKMDVLLVAVRNDFLKNYLDLILDLGLKTAVVDIDSLAVLNAYEVNYEIDPNRITALINVGFDVTNLVFIKDGVYHSTRDISSGTRSIYEAIQKEFRLTQEMASKAMKGELNEALDLDMFKASLVSSAEELVSGLEVAFSYFKTSARVPQVDWIVMSGGGALVPYLPEFLQSKLGISVEIANPLRNIEYDPDIFQDVQPEKIAPLLAVAVGLAVRKVK